MSDLLNRARAFEAERLPAVSAGLLPRFHVTGGIGWLNDPNGFSLYRGEYHLFFQYNPYDIHWSTMHWGHVKTRDFVHWEHLPCALAPDRDYDRDGCYSGSAIELQDGRHLLMYTGVRRTGEGDDEVQTQCLAFGDGVDYAKYPGNPVLDANALPSGGSYRHFRDCKLWAENGRFYTVAGNLGPDGRGAALLFESNDAMNWRYVRTLAKSDERHGRMWECPDFFRLDGKQVLIVSPQEVDARSAEFIDGNTTLCLIGSQTPDGDFNRDAEQTVDYGLDFYAPQTVLAADGRRVMIAWMQYWNSVDVRPVEHLPFFGQMTLPRELNVRDGRLIQNPVRELNGCRRNRVSLTNIPLSGEAAFPGICGRSLDLTVRIRPGDNGTFRGFTLYAAEGGEYVTTILYRPGTNAVLVDRSKSGWPETVLNHREFAVRDRGGEIELRLILDRYSLELFVNGGEQAATFAIFAPEAADGVRFEADGEMLMDVDKYDLILDGDDENE